MARCNCCGCQIADDYGTSTVAGSGTLADPYTVTRLDPSFVRPMVRVTGGVQAALASGTPTAVIFTAEVFDTDSMWTAGSPTLITLQKDGFYVFGSTVFWPSNVNGNRISSFVHTPVSGPSMGTITKQENAPTGDMRVQLNYQWYFSAGDTLRLDVTQASGGALNLTSSIAWAVYIGRKV